MIIDELFEEPQQCPECGGISFSDLILAEKKDACYHKVKASAKVWPSAYASGRLVQCRKKGAANYGNKSEGVAEAGPLDQRRNLPPLTGTELGGGSQVPQFRLPIIPDNMPGGANMPGVAGMSRNIATQRSVGGKAIPSLGQAGKMVTSPATDKALTKLGGKNVSTTSGPAVTVQKRGSEYEPLAVDVPAYVRQGKPDPVTTPVGKPKITVRPGETVPQAIQRAQTEKEFGQFLKGQSGQTFGAGAGRGTVNPPAAKSNAPKELTINPNDPKTFTKQATASNPEMDKIMKKWDQEQRSTPASLSSPSKSKTSPSKFLQLFGPDKMDEASRKKRETPEVEYDDEYDAMVARVKRLAGLGPMKTVYDPKKRQYRNMPTAQQPKK